MSSPSVQQGSLLASHNPNNSARAEHRILPKPVSNQGINDVLTDLREEQHGAAQPHDYPKAINMKSDEIEGIEILVSATRSSVTAP